MITIYLIISIIVLYDAIKKLNAELSFYRVCMCLSALALVAIWYLNFLKCGP